METREIPLSFKVVLVFQDSATRIEAMRIYSKLNQMIGDDSVQSSWWNICHFLDPIIIFDAARAAAEAFVVVVSLHAAEELPRELCEWTSLWSNRDQVEGGLMVALIGTKGIPSHIAPTKDYLRSVAQSQSLEFLCHELGFGEGSPEFPGWGAAHPVQDAASAPGLVPSHRSHPYEHGGLND